MKTKLLPGVICIHPFLTRAGVEDVSALISEAEVRQVIDTFIEIERVTVERRALKTGMKNCGRTLFDEARAGKPFTDPALADRDFRKRLAGLQVRIEDQARSIWGICLGFLSRVDPLMRPLFEKREEDERAEAKSWGVGFTQSPVLRAIHAHIEACVRGQEALNNAHIRGSVVTHPWHQHCQIFVQLDFPQLTTVEDAPAQVAA